MAEQTSGEIDIDATPEEVMKVITAFSAYPKWAKGVKKAKIEKKDAQGRPSEVSMEAGQMGFNATYTLTYKYKAKNGGLSWTTAKAQGVVKDIKGEYVLKEKDDATHVTYSTTMQLAMPVPGMVKRQAERTIIDTALKGLKKRVEKG
jgi:carbon monoxide dehydrogenase subunit G